MDDIKQFLIDVAYCNSYAIIIGKHSIEEILNSETPYFAHPPYDLVDQEVIDMLIRHFEEIEDYEKCKNLQEFWNSATTKEILEIGVRES